MREQLSRHLPVKPVDFLVLLSLARQELHGYGLVQSIREQSEGKVVLVPSNLYAVLRRLRGARLIARGDRRPVPGGDAERASARADQRRRYYKITPLGREVLQAEAERLARLLDLAASAKVVRTSRI